MKHQPKLNEKYMASLHCMSSFEVTSYNNLKDTATKFYIFLFNGFTQGDHLVFYMKMSLHHHYPLHLQN